jgi:hypothetical protein
LFLVICVPVPVLIKLPAPEITPVCVVEVLFAPIVKVVPVLISIAPAPAIEPIVSVVSLS